MRVSKSWQKFHFWVKHFFFLCYIKSIAMKYCSEDLVKQEKACKTCIVPVMEENADL